MKELEDPSTDLISQIRIGRYIDDVIQRGGSLDSAEVFVRCHRWVKVEALIEIVPTQILPHPLNSQSIRGDLSSFAGFPSSRLKSNPPSEWIIGMAE